MLIRRKLGAGEDPSKVIEQCKRDLKERMWREVWCEEIDLDVNVELRDGEVRVESMGRPRGVRQMGRGELEALFAERKRALLEVRDELDRRDRERGKRDAGVEFCDYVGDGQD